MRWLKWGGVFLSLTALVVAVVAFAKIGGDDAAQAENVGGSQSQRGEANTAGDSLEALIAQKSGLSLDTITKIEIAALGAAGDKGQSLGLSPAQTASLKPEVVSPLLNDLFSKAAQAAGVSNADLFNGLANGQSLAEIASSHGRDAATLKASISAAIQSELTSAQSSGLLNALQGAFLSSQVSGQLDKIINGSHQKGP